MFDVTNFLMRWLFLCNLVRDVAEIQTLPYHPQPAPPPIEQIQHQISTVPVSCEEEWRDSCLRGILSYPPGSQRLFVMDALRLQLVQMLSNSLYHADIILRRYQRGRLVANEDKYILGELGGEDPYLDADMEILKTFEQATSLEQDDRDPAEDNSHNESPDERQTVLVISNNGTIDTDSRTFESSKVDPALAEPLPSPGEIEDAQRTIRHVREFLPQLVSVVLKSPPAFDPSLVDPVQKLRRLIIQRCIDDANWGIDMCWLLEAEVGRAWKTLFEHRQQTGKRLIVVLPADKAAVLAKIGTEKREAFDLLQDAEQATAYGYTISMDEQLFYQYGHPEIHHPPPRSGKQHPMDPTEAPQPRLPSSISLRRCSHFGDTMHFIDRLTRISLDLRHVPTIHRHVSSIS